MAKRSGKKGDLRNLAIFLLLCIVGIESYLLLEHKKIFNPFKKESSVPTVKKKTPKSSERTSVKKEPAYKQPTAPVVPTALPTKTIGKLAFIIDDWGYTTHNCRYLNEISAPVTVSVLPSLAHTQDVIDCAFRSGKEVMLHLPMEPHNNTDEYPPDYLIKTSMGDRKAESIISNILDRMPHIVGVNNHMGSKATEDERIMGIVFRQLKNRGLFFVDSKVTAKSICRNLARKMGVSFVERDIFLDNKNDRARIVEQLNLMAQQAKKRGVAIAIGHDRELTMQVLKENIPLLQAQGFKIVTVKEILNSP